LPFVQPEGFYGDSKEHNNIFEMDNRGCILLIALKTIWRLQVIKYSSELSTSWISGLDCPNYNLKCHLPIFDDEKVDVKDKKQDVKDIGTKN
jgi:hypothetical protein